jgi:predicted RNA-binding Zn-ribbon protein involved in translation (DUF1610 family)
MPKCPICGARISSSKAGSRGREPFECPECKTKLRQSSSVLGLYVITAILAFIMMVSIEVYIIQTFPGTQYYTATATTAKIAGGIGPLVLIFLAPTIYWQEKAPLVIVERRPRCSHCNTIITQQNPEFCPGCGERLSTEDLKGIPPRRITRKKS